MAVAENISGEEEEMELNNPCTLEKLNGWMCCGPQVDAWKIEAADCGDEAE